MLIMWHCLKCLFIAFLMTVSRVIGRAVSDIGNPVVPNSNCERPESSYVCDPDRLLTIDEGSSNSFHV